MILVISSLSAFRRIPISRRGMSIIEIMVVVALSTTILMVGTLLMNRTTKTFQKGTDMLNTQVLMDGIIENLRSDIRSLRELAPKECNESMFSFYYFDKGVKLKIVYEYDHDEKTLRRTKQRLVNGDASKIETSKTDFHGPKQVESFIFLREPEKVKSLMSTQAKAKEDFQYITVAMRVKTDEKTGYPASSLAIVCQFSSKCVDLPVIVGR